MQKRSLDAEKLEHYRQRLLDHRQQLVNDLHRLEGDLEDEASRAGGGMESDAPTHTADAGSQSFSRSQTLQEAERHRETIRHIEEALQRIEDGAYGVCEEGGELIEAKRLEARPWAKLCLEHARELEPEAP
jgi:RNA polymerase-binding protein DksA